MPVDPTALVALALADALGDDLPGGAWAGERPADPATLPYAVVVDLGGSAAYDSGDGDAVDEAEAAVTVFAASRAAAAALGRAARAALVDAAGTLDAAAGTLLYLRPATPPTVTLDPAKGPGGEDVWRADLSVRAFVEID